MLIFSECIQCEITRPNIVRIFSHMKHINEKFLFIIVIYENNVCESYHMLWERLQQLLY